MIHFVSQPVSDLSPNNSSQYRRAKDLAAEIDGTIKVQDVSRHSSVNLCARLGRNPATTRWRYVVVTGEHVSVYEDAPEFYRECDAFWVMRNQ